MSNVNELSNAFTIPSFNFDKLQAKIDKLNKRANKINVPNIVLTQKQTRIILDPTLKKGEPKRHIEVIDVIVEGESPKLEGWEFIGSLDHVTVPGATYIKTVPGQKMPSEFYDAPAICNHCGFHRIRKDTFVLRNTETGNYMQVGRQCTKDFFGNHGDPQQLARFLSTVWTTIHDMEQGFSFDNCGGKFEYMYNSTEVLQNAIRSMKLDGFITMSQARDNDSLIPTANHVAYVMSPPPSHPIAIKEWKKEKHRMESAADTTHELQLIKDAKQWLDAQVSDSEYFHNLKNIVNMEHIPSKLFGIWTSLIATYTKHLSNQESVEKVSEYVGSIKQRLNFNVKVVHKTGFDSYYGWVNVIIMLDDKGRTLTWLANTSPDMQVGQCYNIDGTIKKHEERNNWKQTQLSRVKVKETLNGFSS